MDWELVKALEAIFVLCATYISIALAIRLLGRLLKLWCKRGPVPAERPNPESR